MWSHHHFHRYASSPLRLQNCAISYLCCLNESSSCMSLANTALSFVEAAGTEENYTRANVRGSTAHSTGSSLTLLVLGVVGVVGSSDRLPTATSMSKFSIARCRLPHRSR